MWGGGVQVIRDDAQRRPGHQPRRHQATGEQLSFENRRSTKAGASTPATPVGDRRRVVARPRSTKAGASTPATPVGDRRRVVARPRSTKAGASTPATQRARHQRLSIQSHAQRRPGHQPRRHSTQALIRIQSDLPLNEGRGINPGDTRRVRLTLKHVRRRSTKAGASTPATH